MSPVLRTLLMWLLMLAIPVQGFAASAMLHCGPSHQRQQLAAAVHATDGDHAAHHAQHGHHAGHGGNAGVSDSAAEDDGAAAPMAAAKCSACANCCYATALPSASPSIGAVTPDTAVGATAAPGFEVIVPDGLERPPRPTLA